jgi:AcrR family transcriptional regulator
VPARRPRTAPRKRPKQERSRDTVQVILAAAQRILTRDGLDALTTARIAEVAGISVGSLYQYFPNKEAVCGALVEKTTEDYYQALRMGLEATKTMPLEPAFRLVVAGLLRVLGDAPLLHRELLEMLSAAGRREMYWRYLGRYTELLEAWLRARGDEVRERADLAAYVVVRAADGIGQAIAHDRPDPARFEALVDELTDLGVRYMRRM